MTILGVGGEEARAIATEIVDRWSRGEGPLHEAITAALLSAESRARREAAEEMRERAAKEAQSWQGLKGVAVANKIRALPSILARAQMTSPHSRRGADMDGIIAREPDYCQEGDIVELRGWLHYRVGGKRYDYESDKCRCPACGSVGMPWAGWWSCDDCDAKALISTGEVFRMCEP